MKRLLILLVSAALCALMLTACSGSSSDVEISAQDAANLIKTYDSEDLGIDDDISNHSVLTNSDNEIDGEQYYKVIIADVAEPDENGYVGNIEPLATFYVSYDGQTIMTYDEDNDEYTKFKDVHDVPTTEAVSDTFEEAETEAEETAADAD